MAHRKHFEKQLEDDLAHWGNNVKFYLADSTCTSYIWHVICQNTIYEISYADTDELTIQSSNVNHNRFSSIRKIYSSNTSKTSYHAMLSSLSDNFVDII
jgi:hypothetical protein